MRRLWAATRRRVQAIADVGHETFMRQALDAARRALEAGEVPVGALVVVEGRVVAVAHNAPSRLSDPTAHAEVLAIREAGRVAGNYRLPGASLYATVEPCAMCCGAIINARIEHVIYGARDVKAGAVESLFQLLGDPRLNHRPLVTAGVLAGECAEILQGFFRIRRM